MRILFVTPYPPSPIRVRPYNFVKALSRRHEVIALSLWESERERQDLVDLQAHCPTVGVPLSRARALANCLRALPSRTPLQGAYCRSPELISLLEVALGRRSPAGPDCPRELRGGFDVVHV